MKFEAKIKGMERCPRCGRKEDGTTVLEYSYLSNFLDARNARDERYNARDACTKCDFSIDVGAYADRAEAVSKVVSMWNAECEGLV